MRFGEEIFKLIGGENPARIAYTVSDGGVYLRNVRRIREFSNVCIECTGKHGGVRIEGDGLEISKYAAGDVVVRGNVHGVLNTD